MGREQPMPGQFEHNRYTVRKKKFRSRNEAVSVYDPDGQLLLYADEKASETLNIPVFADESMKEQVMSVILSGTPTNLFDVFDTVRQEKIGAVERALTPLLRERWIVKDVNYEETVALKESGVLAPLYRLCFPHKDVPAFIVRRYRGYAGRKRICRLKQRLGYIMRVDLSDDAGRFFDRRLAIAVAIIIALKELHSL